MRTRLIYGFDPLCGWCFGFGPALRALREALPDLEIELRMGGLVTGERIRPYIEGADYIEQASARMRAMTGVAIGAAFKSRILRDPMVISSSVPPCDALQQVRRSARHRVLDMAEALQIAHFSDGMDLNNSRTYAAVAQGISLELTFQLPGPGAVSQELEQEFAASRALGLTSFPSLLIDSGGSHKGVEVSYDRDLFVRRIAHELSAG